MGDRRTEKAKREYERFCGLLPKGPDKIWTACLSLSDRQAVVPTPSSVLRSPVSGLHAPKLPEEIFV